MRKLLFVVVLFVVYTAESQQKLGSFKNSLKTSSSKIKDVIPIVNKKNGDIAFFIADAKNVYGYKLNNTFQLTDELSSVEKSRKYKVLIGSSIAENGDYRAFLTNKSYDKFSFIDFSFSKKESYFKEFKFLNSNEKFIQTVNYNNEFYLITAAKISSYNKSFSGLFMYTFDSAGKPVRKEINTQGLSFVSKSDVGISIPELLIQFSDHIKKIKDNVPASIELAADLDKMYQRDNTIIFSFDENKKFAQFLKIDLDSFKASSISFKKPLDHLKQNRKKTNSFLNGNKLFTIAANKDIFKMNVQNFDNKSLIREFIFTKDDTIKFKNTPIIQEGGMYDNYRELEKSKKFLRKITAGKMGISSIKVGDNYHVTIGGYVLQNGGGMMMPMGGFGAMPIASFGSVNMFFNPVQFAYNSMSNTKSTRIECLFDENFNHVEGEIEETAFDKISEHKPSSNTGETIFKYDGYYILGTYSTFTKKYKLEKFIE